MKPMTPPVPPQQILESDRPSRKPEKREAGQNAPIMHIPHIRQRDDPLLHQVPQILHRRTRATPPGRPHRERHKRALRVCVHALRIPLAHRGRHGCWQTLVPPSATNATAAWPAAVVHGAGRRTVDARGWRRRMYLGLGGHLRVRWC
jgi:hypothetical protein